MVESTNQVQAFHEPPSLRLHCSSAQQWVTPELGLSSTPRQGILGQAEVTGKTTHNHKEGILSKEPPTLTAHKPSFPTCLFHPRRVHLLCHLDSPSAASLPYLGLQEQTRPEVSDSMAAIGFLPGVLSFLCVLSHLEEFLTGQQASRSPLLHGHNNPQRKNT